MAYSQPYHGERRCRRGNMNMWRDIGGGARDVSGVNAIVNVANVSAAMGNGGGMVAKRRNRHRRRKKARI
jgi:hypothetical protein